MSGNQGSGKMDRTSPKIFLVVVILILISLACNLPSMAKTAGPQNPPGHVETSIAETIIARGDAPDVVDQGAEGDDNAAPPASDTPEFTETPTLTLLSLDGERTMEILQFENPPVKDKWILIDLSDQYLAAYEGKNPVYAAWVSTGLPGTPTLKGEFHVYVKLESTRMRGSGYDLSGVPHTMYYNRGYAIHGAYWHENFGQPMSHGCVNLDEPDAEWIYEWTSIETLVKIVE